MSSKKQMTVAELANIVEQQGKCITELTEAYADNSKLIAQVVKTLKAINDEHKRFDDTLNTLRDNFCKCECCNEEPIEPNDVDYWIEELQQWYHTDKATLIYMMKTMQMYAPGAFVSFIINPLARIIDEEYDGKIQDCDTVYCVSTCNGNVCVLPKNNIKSWRYFGAFRTQEDGVYALKVWLNLKSFINKLIDSESQC